MANTPVPIDLALLNGNTAKISKEEILRRKQSEKALKVAKDKLKPPIWLGKIAKKEFKYVVNETDTIDLLSNLDLHVLAIYCNVYEQYVRCTNRIINDGIMVEANKSSETVVAAHPLFVKQDKLFDQLRKMQTDLGLSPSARARLAMKMTVEDKEEGEFDDV
ncbi:MULTISPECIES: phage terminase small subunit P27 family [unclassified Granulicatella]|uniref:phage terminase small subunit P27 family n=1 Tax=unclassified Granulicatella TaxID=2630493 RepID=UPI001431FC3A|nr:phage terminase small subunit P27 family [Granulicatella sp. WM01]MBF0780503.1 phage terminase small subunit P27 family [Granulicatella sp. 19428wC4_WM01]